MAPNPLRIDWAQLLEVLAEVGSRSFVVGRALAIIFEHR